MIYLKRLFFKMLGKNPATMDMVRYWKTKDSVQAKVTEIDGVTKMIMEGEKYVFPGFPRGYLLYGKLSKLKHEIKNQIFNDSWATLERGEDIITPIKREILPRIYTLMKESEYEMIPAHRTVTAVREINRALSKVAPEHSEFVKLLTFILQEDDAYRFRVMDMAEYFNPNLWWKKILRFITLTSYRDSIRRDFEIALTFVEHCEIVGDMKERIRLLRRVLLAILQDEGFMNYFEKFCKEVKWKKVYLTEADRYYFRGKYYKTDYRLFDY